MNPEQYAAYMAWLNAGAQGAPPAWTQVNAQQQAAQEQAAAQAVAIAQNSGMGQFYDLTGTNANAPVMTAPNNNGLYDFTLPGTTPTAQTVTAPSPQVSNPVVTPTTSTAAVPSKQYMADYQAAIANWGPNQPIPGYNDWVNQMGLGAAGPSTGPATGTVSNTPLPGLSFGPNGTIIGTPNTSAPNINNFTPGPGGTITGGTTGIVPGTDGITPGTTTAPSYPSVGGTTGQPAPGGTTYPSVGGNTGTTPPATTTTGPATTDPIANVPITWPTEGSPEGVAYGQGGRNIGAELGAVFGYAQPFAQQGFNIANQLSPQYTQLNTQNYLQSLGALAPGMQQSWASANPQLAAFQSQLGGIVDSVNANTPTGATTNQYTAATASPTIAPTAALSEVGGPGFTPVTGSNITAQTGFNSIGVPTTNAGLQTATSMMASGGPSSIQQLLEQQALEGLQLGGQLSAEDVRNAQQAAREGWGARGLINSTGSVAAEVLNRDAISRQRQLERQQLASTIDQIGFGQRQQGFNNALGVSNANLGYANLGLNAAQSNLGAQLTGNQLNFAGQQANQQNALQALLANQSAGLNYAQLATQNAQQNAANQNAMAQFGANLGQQNNQFNASAQNSAAAQNAAAANAMAQFNQNLAFQGNQNVYNNAMGYGQFLQGNTVNPFAVAQGLSAGGQDYTNSLLNYGSDVFNTNYNAQQAAQIAAANNSAAKQGATIGAIGQVGGAALGAGALSAAAGAGGLSSIGLSTIGSVAKVFIMCVPDGEWIDLPDGGKRMIQDIRAGDMVIGYRGEPVRVLQKHEYAENPKAVRFHRFHLDDGSDFSVCDMHRIGGVRAKDHSEGDILGVAQTITKITKFGGVTRSYDLLTEDGGYRMSGVAVDSMIPELNRLSATMVASHATFA